MKIGDLVRRKDKPFESGWLALVLKVENGFVWVRWFDDGTIDDCSASLMEVISESR